MIRMAALILLTFLVSGPYTAAPVVLQGATCPVRIVLGQSSFRSSASVDPTIEGTLELAALWIPRSETLGLIAERSTDATAPNCEITLQPATEFRSVMKYEFGAADLLPVVWAEVGEQHDGRSFVVPAGSYRFRFTYLLEQPRKAKNRPVVVWTVRSEPFVVEETRSWHRFRDESRAESNDRVRIAPEKLE